MRRRKWQVRVASWLGNREHGLLFLGARRASHHGFPYLLPDGTDPRTGKLTRTSYRLAPELIENLGIQPRGRSWVLPDLHSLTELLGVAEFTMQRAPQGWAQFLVAIEEATR